MKNLKKSLTFLFLSFCATIIAQDEVTIDKSHMKVTQKLLKNKKIQGAFDRIEALETLTVARHIELNEIEAPPFKEEKRAKVFADYFTKLELDTVWIDTEGNVLGLMHGSEGKRTVALDAHLDTVFP